MDRLGALAHLEDLGRAMAAQDEDGSGGKTHATAWPVYEIQEQVRVYGIDPSSADPDGHISVNADGEECDVEEADSRVYFVTRWEVLSGAVFMVRANAEAFLKCQARNHGPLRIRLWVGSAHDVPEMRLLQAALIALAKDGG